MKRMMTVLIMVLALTMTINAAELGFSGDATLVSTYVWRGINQFNGAAMQGTAELSYGALAVGYWISTMQGGVAVETDPYVGVSLPTGPVETSIGATIYSYDFFARQEYTVYEIFASAGYGPVSASFYYTPKQNEVDGVYVVDEAVYWLELMAGTSVLGADLAATLGLGSYSAASADDSVTNLLLTAGKSVSDAVAVSWNWNVALSDGLDNTFFMTASYGF